MSAVVQQQEHSSDDPPHWFGYNWAGKSLKEPEVPKADKDEDSFPAEEESPEPSESEAE